MRPRPSKLSTFFKESAEVSDEDHRPDHVESGICCIVCMDGYQEHSPVEIAGLLVHEAVHVWQRYCESMGEESPGAEQEAYGIQPLLRS